MHRIEVKVFIIWGILFPVSQGGVTIGFLARKWYKICIFGQHSDSAHKRGRKILMENLDRSLSEQRQVRNDEGAGRRRYNWEQNWRYLMVDYRSRMKKLKEQRMTLRLWVCMTKRMGFTSNKNRRYWWKNSFGWRQKEWVISDENMVQSACWV